MRVTAINDDVTFFEMGDKLVNKGVNGITSLNKEDNFAWSLQLGNELLDGVSALHIGAYRAENSLIRLWKQSQA